MTMTEYPSLDPEVILRCAIKEIDNTMVPEVLIPSYMVFGALRTMPATQTKLPNEKDTVKAIKIAELATISSHLRIQIGFRSRIPPASSCKIDPGDRVHAFSWKYKKYHWAYIVEKICIEEVYPNVDGTIKHFSTSQNLPDRNSVADSEPDGLEQAFSSSNQMFFSE